MSTRERLVEAAASLLDEGGEGAVTLRAVGKAAGVSHNAPYKHFDDRSALLGAVAIQDFAMLADSFAELGRAPGEPLTRLQRALDRTIAYGEEHLERYRLLFSNPDIAAHGGEVEAAALRCFTEFAALVRECQEVGVLPGIGNAELTGLIYACIHGLIDLQAGGRMRKEKGLDGVRGSAELLVALLSRPAHP